ncbi:MAG: transcriptional regulator [Bacillus sp. (in: firmicutes)]
MSIDLNELPLMSRIALWCVLAALLLTQSTLIFLSARKRGKNAWFWGFIGLLNIPSSTILYYLFVIYRDKKKRRK